jgi:phage terminase small subunit
MPKKLTTKQHAFVLEYLVDFNATEAALRAGYKGGRATLANIGTTNLAKPRP